MKEENEGACHKRKKMSGGRGVEDGDKAAQEEQRQRAADSDIGKWESASRGLSLFTLMCLR